jgi:hypothetical protein
VVSIGPASLLRSFMVGNIIEIQSHHSGVRRWDEVMSETGGINLGRSSGDGEEENCGAPCLEVVSILVVSLDNDCFLFIHSLSKYQIDDQSRGTA